MSATTTTTTITTPTAISSPTVDRKGEQPDGDEVESEMDTKDDNGTGANGGSDGAKDAASAPCPHTVIIFDWDDTLLASSFLSSRGYRLDSPMDIKSAEHESVEQQLRELEQAVCSLLNMALTYGTVHIVTNAETGWVQLSAQKFMPAVVPLLSKVVVLSARSTFEPMHPDSPLKWKYFAFHEKLSSHYGVEYKPSSASKKNVISFGDSHVEREAVRAVTRSMASTRCKSVKFAERPSTEQLRRQLELVSNCFHYIHHHDGDLDLQLTVTVNSPPASPATNEPNA